jgi:hypothetical protein
MAGVLGELGPGDVWDRQDVVAGEGHLAVGLAEGVVLTVGEEAIG